MTVKEFYEVIGGDYNKVMEILKRDEMVLVFANMFLEDTGFQELDTAMKEKDYEMAFKAAHKFKGVCQNMAFARMAQVAEEITEALRGGADIAKAEQLFPELEEIYLLTVSSISSMN